MRTSAEPRRGELPPPHERSVGDLPGKSFVPARWEDRLEFFCEYKERSGLRQRLLLAPQILLQLPDPPSVLARLLRRGPCFLGPRQRRHRTFTPFLQVRG